MLTWLQPKKVSKMDIVQNFIKEQFNDDDEYYEPSKEDQKAKREVSHLKKELDELKFYQELERTEYEDMKRKMYDLEKKQKGPKSSPRNLRSLVTNTDDGSRSTEADDLFDSLTEDDTNTRTHASTKKNDKKHAALVEKLKQKEEEIARLGKKFKLETDPKEFSKRMHKLEKVKNEEIEEIKTHYKGLMEQLAKQIQKATERHDDEIGKNSGLRSTMEEMRQDMASREQDLEEKLLEMEAVLKKAETKTYKVEQKLILAEENLANNQVKLSSANEIRDEVEKRMRELEEDFEDERREMISTFERGKDFIQNEGDRERVELHHSIQDMREQLREMQSNLEVEKSAHEESVAQMKEAQSFLAVKGREFDQLSEEARESEREAKSHQERAERQISRVKEECQRQLDESSEKIKRLVKEKMSLKNELKNVSQKANAADKKADLMSDSTAQKQGALRRKNVELEAVQLELRSLCDKHMKDVKARDLQFVRERKKWQTTEQGLKNELIEIRNSPAYQRVLLSKSPSSVGDVVGEAGLKEIVEQLRSEKASLQLQMTTFKQRSTRDVQALERKIKNIESGKPVVRIDPLYHGIKKSNSGIGATTEHEGVAKPSTPATRGFKYAKIGSNSSLYASSLSQSASTSSRSNSDAASVAGPEVAEADVVAAPGKIERKSLANATRRRQLRNRKFKKSAE